MNNIQEFYSKILRNSAICNNCNDEIESVHRHDFVTCKCGNVSVDGGREYIRRAFKTYDWIETTEYELMSREEILNKIEYFKRLSRDYGDTNGLYTSAISDGENLLKD